MACFFGGPLYSAEYHGSRRVLPVVLLLTLCLGGLAVIPGGCAAGRRVELLVSAATSLKPALSEVAAAYGDAHPHVQVSLNFGSSGSLRSQIEQGAPVDVFVSAGAREMEALAARGLLDAATRKDLLGNRIALVVPAVPRSPVRGWEDLGCPEVRRVAIATPETSPCGDYAREVLYNLGLWESVQAKLVLAKDVLEVVAYVTTGNVDAGVVFLSDSRDRGLRMVAEAPAGSHRPVVYQVAVVGSSRHPGEAREFVEFLAGEEAAGIFRKHGLDPLTGDGK